MHNSADNSDAEPLLLAVIELGGYPDFRPLYRQLGYRVEQLQSGRKALGYIKKHRPQVVVAEFNYQLEFRDRTSQLESLLAVVQAAGGGRVLVYYYPEEEQALSALHQRFPFFEPLPRPIDEAQLLSRLPPAGERP